MKLHCIAHLIVVCSTLTTILANADRQLGSLNCSAGFEGNSLLGCIPCAANFFKSTNGFGQCEPCSTGKSAYDMVLCPCNATQNSVLVCKPGYHKPMCVPREEVDASQCAQGTDAPLLDISSTSVSAAHLTTIGVATYASTTLSSTKTPTTKSEGVLLGVSLVGSVVVIATIATAVVLYIRKRKNTTRSLQSRPQREGANEVESEELLPLASTAAAVRNTFTINNETTVINIHQEGSFNTVNLQSFLPDVHPLSELYSSGFDGESSPNLTRPESPDFEQGLPSSPGNNATNGGNSHGSDEGTQFGFGQIGLAASEQDSLSSDLSAGSPVSEPTNENSDTRSRAKPSSSLPMEPPGHQVETEALQSAIPEHHQNVQPADNLSVQDTVDSIDGTSHANRGADSGPVWESVHSWASNAVPRPGDVTPVSGPHASPRPGDVATGEMSVDPRISSTSHEAANGAHWISPICAYHDVEHEDVGANDEASDSNASMSSQYTHPPVQVAYSTVPFVSGAGHTLPSESNHNTCLPVQATYSNMPSMSSAGHISDSSAPTENSHDTYPPLHATHSTEPSVSNAGHTSDRTVPSETSRRISTAAQAEASGASSVDSHIESAAVQADDSISTATSSRSAAADGLSDDSTPPSTLHAHLG